MEEEKKYYWQKNALEIDGGRGFNYIKQNQSKLRT